MKLRKLDENDKELYTGQSRIGLTYHLYENETKKEAIACVLIPIATAKYEENELEVTRNLGKNVKELSIKDIIEILKNFK